ncbi:two-component system response regulator QseB [Novosphingobium sp. PhB165]|uniref:response regulator n=1 Tax=Novosphingobium sp. PhB165 TaxID=2485105 RepID=UPI00104B835E|nr:response regulator transcription factor [Novosphingobium sp. PhB165]TCM20851.1 two-component system response regulator QseB [Novosphingobium sp. PhB165]
MRLLIVEDNPELAELIGLHLAEAGFPNDIVSTADEARAFVETGHHAAMLLDLGLPDEDGIVLLRQLRAAGHFLPVLVLTARSAIADRVAGLNAGADDYLPKPFAAEELIARVAALLRRATGDQGGAIACGQLRYDVASQTLRVDDTTIVLAPREVQLLDLLMRHRDKVVRKSQIESAFFGLGEEFSSNAAEVSVHRLRKRLMSLDVGAEIVTVRGLGYLLRSAQEK